MFYATEIRPGSRKFRDIVHFPYGFSRSGDFSIPEARLLENYGDTLWKLSHDEMLPDGEEEQRFVDVVLGECAPETIFEKVWVKYLLKSQRRNFHTLFRSGRSAEVDTDPEVMEEV